jgi:iron complex outermembrane receptor protein
MKSIFIVSVFFRRLIKINVMRIKFFFLFSTIFLGLYLLSTSNLLGQISGDNLLRGVVSDGEGSPLVGATIIIVGANSGVMSGSSGEYSIDVASSGTYRVRASFIGYTGVEVETEIKGNTQQDFVLTLSDVLAGEVVVNATRAGERTPQTYSVIDQEIIKRQHTGMDMPFLLSLTPSLVETSEAGNGIGYTNMRIRGTDANRINVTIDGIPLNDPESQQVFWVNLPDIASSVDNIQVQRGVGTSSNGPAAFGATVSMETKMPEIEPFAEVDGSLGSFNTSKMTLAAGSGLVNGKFALQMRVSDLRSDGYVYRTGSEHRSAMVTTTYRTGSSSLKLNILYGKEHTGIGWWGNPQEMLDVDRRYNPAGEYYDSLGVLKYYDNESDNYIQSHFQLSWNKEISDNLSLSFATFYTIGDGYYEEYKDDADLADYGLLPASVNETDLVRQKWMSNDYLGTIYSLKYSAGNIEWVIGGTANYFEGDHYGKIIWTETEEPLAENYQWYLNSGDKGEVSIYAKGEIMISNRLSVYGDFQYRFASYKMRGPDDDFKILDQNHLFNFFNPKAGIFFSLNDKQDIYLSFSVGNREPTRSDYKEAAGDPTATPKPERLYDTEFGYSLESTKVSTRMNLYAMIYDNQLVPTGELSNTGYSIMTNVDKSYRIGAEISAGIKPFKFLEWNIGTTLSSNKIIDFVEYYTDYNTIDWSESYLSKNLGKVDIAYSPNIISTSDINFIISDPLELHFISKFVGRQYFDNTMSNDRMLEPYFVNNANINWNPEVKFAKDFAVQLAVNNILNKKYISNAYGGNWYEDGTENTWAYYFPQAGTNFLIKISIKI